MDVDDKSVGNVPGRSQRDTAAEEITVASSKDLDETYEIYKQQGDDTDLDPEEARRVLRKIDWHILPLLMGSYMLQYLDKSSINFASVYGLQKGTNLHGQDYSWLSSIFYFGSCHLHLRDFPPTCLDHHHRLPLCSVPGGLPYATAPRCQGHWCQHLR